MQCGIFLLLIAVLNLLAGSAADWSYDSQENWPGMCNVGRKQSPIAITEVTAHSRRYPRLQLASKYAYDVAVSVTQHAVEIRQISNSEKYNVYGGPLRNRYILDNVHFHRPSEHILNGKRYTLESHLVFYSDKFSGITEALNETEGIAVLGAFYDLNDVDNQNLASIIDNIPSEEGGVSEPINIPFIYFLPNNIDEFFTYEGSLTTPECNEGVRWIVFKQPILISVDQVKNFEVIEENARDLQKLKCRKVYKNI